MFKKTCALGLYHRFGVHFLPAAQANQIEVNKQSATQETPLLVLRVVDQDLNQTSLQNQFPVPGYPGYYHAPSLEHHRYKSLAKRGVQNGAAVGY